MVAHDCNPKTLQTQAELEIQVTLGYTSHAWDTQQNKSPKQTLRLRELAVNPANLSSISRKCHMMALSPDLTLMSRHLGVNTCPRVRDTHKTRRWKDLKKQSQRKHFAHLLLNALFFVCFLFCLLDGLSLQRKAEESGHPLCCCPGLRST